MPDTQFYLPPAQKDRLTAVYGVTKDGKIGRAPNGRMPGATTSRDRASPSAGRRALSTARDYWRHLQMMLTAASSTARAC